MHEFDYRDGNLHGEGVPLETIAREVGTPFYCYSLATLRRHFEVFEQPFEKVPHLVCFSMKANSNLALLRVFLNLGGGLDVVSGGELYRALKAGCDPAKIVFSGVGKSAAEMEAALAAGILMFNVESEQELERLNAVAGKAGRKAPVALRVNPDIDARTHPYISTGLKKNKFGIRIEESLRTYELARSLEHVEPVGVHCHIGSQLLDTKPFVDALQRVKALVRTLREQAFDIRYLDLGGGLGITYNEETPPHPAEYAKALVEEAADLGCTFILEPGRVLVGNAGILVTQVQYIKKSPEKTFVIVDSAMNDCIRPSLYGAYQAIWPIRRRNGEEIRADVVGPICESGDFLAKDRLIPSLEPGDLVAVMSAGAYGFSMSSNYNSRPRVAEVLVGGDRYWVVRKRESYEDLLRGESIPEFLAKT
ncbi:MAG: diaminopimelate decarboxylase [bacterium]